MYVSYVRLCMCVCIYVCMYVCMWFLWSYSHWCHFTRAREQELCQSPGPCVTSTCLVKVCIWYAYTIADMRACVHACVCVCMHACCVNTAIIRYNYVSFQKRYSCRFQKASTAVDILYGTDWSYYYRCCFCFFCCLFLLFFYLGCWCVFWHSSVWALEPASTSCPHSRAATERNLRLSEDHSCGCCLQH